MSNTLNPNECGLVLEGGGLRGNYTAGVLDFLMDNNIKFPYIIGVSAGACMGISYVSHQRGRNYQVLEQFHGDPRYVSIRNLLTTRSIFGKDLIFNQIPNKYIIFDWKAFIESPIRYVMVCVDCETGEAVYFEKNDAKNSKDLFKILEASSSMPYTSSITKYKGKKYLDGAICDAIPLKKAQSEGFKLNVVVLTNPAGFRKKEEPHPPNRLMYIGKTKLIQSLKLRVTRYNQNLEYAEAEEKAGRAIIIRPSVDLNVSRVEKDKEKLIQLYHLGMKDAKEVLQACGLKTP